MVRTQGVARDTASDALIVLKDAARLMWRHWPVLFALAFAGLAARQYITSLAVWVSNFHGTLGILVLVLAPITVLASYVLILRAVRPSLPSLTAATEYQSTGGGARRLNALDYVGAVLVPFLTVYAAQNQLNDDVTKYIDAVKYDEIFVQHSPFDFENPLTDEDIESRLPISSIWWLVGIVVVAIALRWMFSRILGEGRRTWLGLPAAYVEVVWLALVLGFVDQFRDEAWEWTLHRRITSGVVDGLRAIADAFGPLASLANKALDYSGSMLTSVDKVLLVPIAWLLVGAIVYGQRIGPPPANADNIFQRAGQRKVHLPGPLRWAAARFSAEMRSRFAPLSGAVRVLLRAGLRPMILFCIAFVLVDAANKWLWEISRLVIGPQRFEALGASLYAGVLDLLNDGVRAVLLMCLLAAAVDRVLRINRTEPEAQEADGSTPEPDPEPVTAAARVSDPQKAGSRA
jgi:hypothetical protein